MPQSILEMTKDLVLAEIQARRLSPEDVPNAIRRTHQNLMTLRSREEAESPVSAADRPRAPSDWRKSIARHTITCLECGVTFKQLTSRHLRLHGLDTRSYRDKYGIPRTQPLMARETTARRKEIVQRTRPWEKAPAYVQAQAKKAAAKKAGKKKGTRRR